MREVLIQMMGPPRKILGKASPGSGSTPAFSMRSAGEDEVSRTILACKHIEIKKKVSLTFFFSFFVVWRPVILFSFNFVGEIVDR